MILIVGKSKSEAEKMSELFNIMGYIALGVAAPGAERFISPGFRSIIILDPPGIPSADFFLNFNKNGLKIPTFALGESDDPRFCLVIKKDLSPSSIIKKLIRYLAVNEKPIIGKYKCAGFDCSAELGQVYFLDSPIKLTKTEKMILRYLTRAYPIPQTATDIIKYAIRPSRHPEPSSIRTHVSVMNKKFKEQIGRPMIEFFDKKGYMLFTPEPKKRILM